MSETATLTSAQCARLLAITPFTASAEDQAIKTALQAAIPPPPPPPPAELDLALVNNGTEVEVVDTPGPVDFALCIDANSSDGKPLYEPKGVKKGERVKGKVGHEWLDAHVEGNPEWWSAKHGRIKVTVAAAPPPPPPPPVEGPKSTTSIGYYSGACMGGWERKQEVVDAKKCGSKPIVRLENPSETEAFTNADVAVIYLNSGGMSTAFHLRPEARRLRERVLLGEELDLVSEHHAIFGYSTAGVKSLNTATVVANAISVVKKHPGILVYEYLNEPGGSWFWGSGAESQENATAYAHQGRAIAEAFVKEFGAHAPKVALSFDGGHAGENGWGKKVMAADPTLFQHPLVFPTNHPYDGSSVDPNKTLVHWGSCEETHKLTGKWPLITEYGRPLMATTGDSPKSTEEQQAHADGAIAHKCREVETIYTAYGYRGDSSPCYAIFHGNDAPRQAVEAIAHA